jgi:hypothetical protein
MIDRELDAFSFELFVQDFAKIRQISEIRLDVVGNGGNVEALSDMRSAMTRRIGVIGILRSPASGSGAGVWVRRTSAFMMRPSACTADTSTRVRAILRPSG